MEREMLMGKAKLRLKKMGCSWLKDCKMLTDCSLRMDCKTLMDCNSQKGCMTLTQTLTDYN
jgi:hypothetical protein